MIWASADANRQGLEGIALDNGNNGRDAMCAFALLRYIDAA